MKQQLLLLVSAMVAGGAMGQRFELVNRIDDFSSNKCQTNVAAGGAGRLFQAGVTEGTANVRGCVLMYQHDGQADSKPAWEALPIPLGKFFFQMIQGVHVNPAGNAVVIGTQRFAGTVEGETGFVGLLDSSAGGAAKWVVNFPNAAVGVESADAESVLVSAFDNTGSKVSFWRLSNSDGSKTQVAPLYPAGAGAAFATAGGYFAFNSDTQLLTRVNKTGAYKAGSGVLLTAVTSARFYAYEAGPAVPNNLKGFSVLPSAPLVPAFEGAALKGLATSVAVSPGDKFFVTCGFAKLNDNDVFSAPLLIQRLNLVTKQIATLEIPQPSSTQQDCAQKGVQVDDDGTVTVAISQTVSRRSKGVLMRLGADASATLLRVLQSASADNIGFGSPAEVRAVFLGKSSSNGPQKYALSGLDNTVATFRLVTGVVSPTPAPTALRPTRRPTRRPCFGFFCPKSDDETTVEVQADATASPVHAGVIAGAAVVSLLVVGAAVVVYRKRRASALHGNAPAATTTIVETRVASPSI
jgi:hypothetical protein